MDKYNIKVTSKMVLTEPQMGRGRGDKTQSYNKRESGIEVFRERLPHSTPLTMSLYLYYCRIILWF